MHINPDEVAQKYNAMQTVWPIDDSWHTYTKRVIDDFVRKKINPNNFKGNFRILNAGSGGESYGISDGIITHLDIAEKRIARFPNSIVSSIENIPAESSYFDMVICVGSVVNYCDLVKALDELSRVTKPGGTLLLEFENSNTMELIFKKDFNVRVALIETIFHNKKEKLWYYSESNIVNRLNRKGFVINDTFRFHILSSLFLRKQHDLERAAYFAKFDPVLRKIPLINKLASNVIIQATKKI